MKNCIAKMRKERGLTLQALADRVGASNQQISHLEKERRGLTVDWLERIAIALDCHPFDLLEPDPALMSINGASLTAIERQLIFQFRRLSETQQEAVLHFLKAMTTKNS
ncbi:MAG: helix-turn-helix transcriptional regulator [Devosiaceae bacterium]|nr:helix-turn-helix transcriptional regulator [Devosiaceae bacterium]